MRLFEFDVHQPIKVIARDLISDGYDVIGQGAGAIVLSKDGEDNIIKLGPANDCWLNMAKISAQSIHLPNISSLEMAGNHYIAYVERLIPVKETFFKTGLFKCIVSWLYLNGGWGNGKEVYLNQYTGDQITQMAQSLEDVKPDMVIALNLIIKAKGSCSFDMHPDNMMRRSDKTLVFQDPLADISHIIR